MVTCRVNIGMLSNTEAIAWLGAKDNVIPADLPLTVWCHQNSCLLIILTPSRRIIFPRLHSAKLLVTHDGIGRRHPRIRQAIEDVLLGEKCR